MSEASQVPVFLELEPQADPGPVAAELARQGVWFSSVGAAGRRGFQLQPHSVKCDLGALEAIEGVAAVYSRSSGRPLLDAQAGQPVLVAGRPLGGGAAPVLAAGPCAVESRAQIEEAAAEVAAAGGALLRGGAFKPRTSPWSFAGVGRRALGWLRDAADRHGLAVVTEVMSEGEVEAVAEVADLLQVGSRNMQNFALLGALGAAGLPVLLKRGMAATVEEWLLAGEHALRGGARGVVFCERGIRGFDPSTRNLLDLGAVALLRHVERQPVLADPSHGAGRRDLIPALSRASLAAGADGLLLEMHPDPARARSDASQALLPAELRALTQDLLPAEVTT
mgnify:CR=1 FL=1